MTTHQRGMPIVSRREFLATSAAAVGAAAVPLGRAAAQGAARYRRLNVANPQAAPVLESYRKAIRAMLALPPTDPRNWYRNALVHTLDCPHGNWWFLPWHRGYVGWFEQTCRELSGDPDFALPYWDWTTEPRVPGAMFDDVLTPNDVAYVATFTDFRAEFQSVVTTFWNTLSDAQFNALLIRGFRFPEDLWWDIRNYPMFFERPNARGLTRQQPDFDPATVTTVSLPTVLNALAPRDFLTFGSAKTLFHSGLTGFGVLEGMPHNRVHNCVGGAYLTPRRSGFMQDNLSPVDPLFFLHHANIDRLWDVWTRKQQAYRYATAPEGDDLARWSNEPFLFFVGPDGRPVAAATAAAYASIGDFDYDYEPGSGEEIVPVPVAAAAPVPSAQSFSAQLTRSSATTAEAASGDVAVPASLLEAEPGPDAPQLFARITVAFPPLAHDLDLRVLVNPPADAGSLGLTSPSNAGTLSIFGRHIMRAPVTFTVPLSAPLADMRAANLLAADEPLNIQVVPQGPTDMGAEVLSIVVEAR